MRMNARGTGRVSGNETQVDCVSSGSRSESAVAEQSEAGTTRGVFTTGTVHSLGLCSAKPSMSLAVWVPPHTSPVAECSERLYVLRSDLHLSE